MARLQTYTAKFLKEASVALYNDLFLNKKETPDM